MDKCPFCGSDAIIEEASIKCFNSDCWEAVIQAIQDSKPKTGSGDTSDDPIIIYCPECGKIDACSFRLGLYCDRCEKWFDNVKYKSGKWYRFETTLGDKSYTGVKTSTAGRGEQFIIDG